MRSNPPSQIVPQGYLHTTSARVYFGDTRRSKWIQLKQFSTPSSRQSALLLLYHCRRTVKLWSAMIRQSNSSTAVGKVPCVSLMKMLAILACCFFGCVLGIPHPIQRSGNNTKCHYPQLPTGYLPVGKSVSVPGDCMQITCQSDLTLSGLTCPSYTLFPGCNLTDVNYFESYPDCCPQIRCPDYGQKPPFKREVAAALVSGSSPIVLAQNLLVCWTAAKFLTNL